MSQGKQVELTPVQTLPQLEWSLVSNGTERQREEGRRKLSCPKRESSSACVASRANVNLVVMLAQPTLAEPCTGAEREAWKKTRLAMRTDTELRTWIEIGSWLQETSPCSHLEVLDSPA